jgi:arylsulfatase A-like enzyme
MEHPNILYFVCHDLGRTLGCYGAEIATPNLDRLAADGVKFSNAFCHFFRTNRQYAMGWP